MAIVKLRSEYYSVVMTKRFGLDIWSNTSGNLGLATFVILNIHIDESILKVNLKINQLLLINVVHHLPYFGVVNIIMTRDMRHNG